MRIIDELPNLGESTLSCMECKRELINLVLVENGPEVRFTAICPCGGRSFTKSMCGKTYTGVPEGLVIDEMDEEKGLYTIRLQNVKI